MKDSCNKYKYLTKYRVDLVFWLPTNSQFWLLPNARDNAH